MTDKFDVLKYALGNGLPNTTNKNTDMDVDVILANVLTLEKTLNKIGWENVLHLMQGNTIDGNTIYTIVAKSNQV